MRSRREQAQQARDILSSLENDLPSAEALDGDRIDGVKVLWITEGRAARDETAFRHALATAHRLREAGERMTDAKIIDAYERAYNLAQAVGADNREPEMPPHAGSPDYGTTRTRLRLIQRTEEIRSELRQRGKCHCSGAKSTGHDGT